MSARPTLLNRGLSLWTGAVLVFLYAPIAVLVAYSFNASRLNVVWEGFTLRWYEAIWRSRPFMRATENSVGVAVCATVLAVTLGTAGAWLLYRYRFRGAAAIETLLAVPMVMPEILMGISLLVFFTLVRFPLGFTTVVIGHVTFCLPFVVAAVQARLQGMDPALEEAALDLGATPLRAFFLVVLPHLGPAIAAGALMAATLSLDELIVTFFTTSSSSTTLPIRIFGMAKVGLNPMLNALSTVFVGTAVLFQLLIGRCGRRTD